MERLTEKNKFGIVTTCFWETNTENGMYDLDEQVAEKIIDRLAAYEDTGLTPEDIDALKKREKGLANLLVTISCGCAVTYSRLEELARAEKDGRLAVLPPNDPLTLEELREMDGEPVWVVCIPSADGECLSTWELVSIEGENKETFLANNLGGRSAYEECKSEIQGIYRHRKEWEAG